MIDKFLYLIAEGFRNLWRTKWTAFASIIAIGIATSFLGFGALVGQDISNILQFARSQYKLEVFFSPLLTDSEASNIVREIGKIPGIKSATLVTKQEAAEIFEKEFGENIFEFLNENPLPSSCVVKFATTTAGSIDITPIIKRIKSLDNVEDVNYRGRLISIIENYYQGFFTIITGVAIIVLIGTIILISNTIRLTIYARRDLIKTLKLVGATNHFIRFPFMVEGIVEGFLGAVVAGIFINIFVESANYFLGLFTLYRVHWNLEIIAIMTVAITILSAIGSRRAVRKFLI